MASHKVASFLASALSDTASVAFDSLKIYDLGRNRNEKEYL